MLLPVVCSNCCISILCAFIKQQFFKWQVIRYRAVIDITHLLHSTTAMILHQSVHDLCLLKNNLSKEIKYVQSCNLPASSSPKSETYAVLDRQSFKTGS